MSTPTPTSTAAAPAPNENQNKCGATAAEKTEDQKIDIIAEPQPSENVALPNPATQSTYQRVEKGTRTALLYWDGWLSAQDARLAEDDPNYFGKSDPTPSGTTTSSTSSSSNSASTGLPLKEPPKRNTNLKKNWTYGKNGEIVYIPTGFTGLFDKVPGAGGNRSAYSAVGGGGSGAAGSGSNTGSTYGNLSNYGGKSPTPLLKQSGPSVGTAWDLKGNPKDRSAYADVTSGRGGLSPGGANNNDANYFGKSDANSFGKSDAKIKRNPNLKKNWTYGKNGEINYISTGFSGIFDKAPGAGGNNSAYSAVGGGGTAAGNRSTYSAVGVSTAGGGGGGATSGSNTGSTYGNVSNYGGKSSTPLLKQSGPSVGTAWDLKGNAKDRSAYADVTSGRGSLSPGGANNNDANYFGSSDAKVKRNLSLKKNWNYGKNGEIIYIPTGFSGLFDKAPGAGGNHSAYSAVGGTAVGSAGGNRSAYSAVGGSGAAGSHSAVGGGSGAAGSHSVGGGGSGAAGSHSIGGGGSGAAGSHSVGGGGSGAAGSGSNTGSTYGNLSNYGGKSPTPLLKQSGPSVGTAWDLKGNPKDRSAYADVVTSGRGGLSPGGANNNDANYFGKSDANSFGKSDAKVKRNPNLKKNWSYGKNGEIIYIPTGFSGHFDKAPNASANHSAYSAAGGGGTASGSHSAVGGGGAAAGSHSAGGGTGHGSNTGSTYGNLPNHGGKSPTPLLKQSGPSVGTAWDLKGKANTRSYYADVKK